MKSLKCPACSEASWRLSVKLSTFRASVGTCGSSLSWTMAELFTSVVAVLRPVWLRRVSLRKSFLSVRSYAAPQRKQSKKGCG